ncbi:MAG: 7-carboxy-7-deazaguanine synthase QueE [Desulfovibrionaceae bacterium]|nr:7-carboxy-7-deazaguanine synthase QueE [Desulfovibrionaceae bacterium]
MVNEIFCSIQGEGYMQGRPAIFIRLQGCKNKCPWCDTKYATTISEVNQLQDDSMIVFQKEKSSPIYSRLKTSFIVEKIKEKAKPGFLVVITGGEPCQQNILALTKDIIASGFDCQIETSGTEQIIVAEKTWITLSPKEKGFRLENLSLANEIKLPVRYLSDIERYEKILEKADGKIICLQPIDCDTEATKLCVQVCKEKNWRLSIQMHKYIGIS